MGVGATNTVHTTGTGTSWSVTFTKRVRLKFLHIKWTSDATAGNRQILIQLLDSSGNEIFSSQAGNTQAASLAYHYFFLPGIYRETTVTSNELEVPIPVDTIVEGGYTLKVSDSNAVSASDAQDVGYQTEDV